MLEKKVREKILKNSIHLDLYGGLAWKKIDALNLITLIMKDKIGILGGDVYKLSSPYDSIVKDKTEILGEEVLKLSYTNLEPLGDNWSCIPKKNESSEEYYLRSKIESINYIEKYPLQEDILFSITLTERFY